MSDETLYPRPEPTEDLPGTAGEPEAVGDPLAAETPAVPDSPVAEVEAAAESEMAEPNPPSVPGSIGQAWFHASPAVDAEPSPVEVTEPTPASPPQRSWWTSGPKTDNPPSAVDPVLPAGTVDLTGENAIPADLRVRDQADTPSVPASLYRDPKTTEEPIPGTVEVDHPVTQPNETVVMPVESVLDDHRAARARALGEVDPGADVVTAPALFTPPSTYKAWPSFVLFVFRLIIATVLSIRATQELLNFSQTKELWTHSILGSPTVFATIQIVLEYVIALMVLIGLASRVAGILMMVLYIGVLTFVVWGAVNPFQSGVIGFRGEYEVLMVAIGLLFAGIGGGRAAVDGAVHHARLERKNAKLG